MTHPRHASNEPQGGGIANLQLRAVARLAPLAVYETAIAKQVGSMQTDVELILCAGRFGCL
jgi:hypothetical protein